MNIPPYKNLLIYQPPWNQQPAHHVSPFSPRAHLTWGFLAWNVNGIWFLLQGHENAWSPIRSS